MAGEFVKASVESVTAAAAAAAAKMPADFRVSITNAPGKGVYPISSFTWLLLYENPKDKAQAKIDGRLHEVGADRRPEVRGRPRLRAAAGRRRQARDGGAREDQVLKRAARAVHAISGFGWGRARSRSSSSSSSSAIGFELTRQSMLSIQKFGLNFWRTDVWDPVAGEFGALPFIWGTLYSSILALAHRHADRARHRRLHLRAVPGWLEAAARVPHRAARGHSVDRLRPLGHLRPGARFVRSLETSTPGAAASAAALQRAAARRRHAGGGAHPRHHGHPVHLVGGARSAEVGAARAARRARTRSAPRASRPSARRSSTRAPASSAPSCSASAAPSARRWR